MTGESEALDDYLTWVCVTHLRFVPCRRNDRCRLSSHPSDVAIVRCYQQHGPHCICL